MIPHSLAPVDPALVDSPSPEIAQSPNGHGGYTAALAAADTPSALRLACGSALRDFPNGLRLTEKQREEKARENDANHTWPINFLDRFTNQGAGNGKRGTHECTTHDLRACFEASWNKQRGIIYPEGPKKDFRYEQSAKGSVWVSPLSIYAEANPGQWGGAGIMQVLNIACRRGFLPDKIQPRDYGFRHSLQGTAGAGGKNQSSGDFVRVSGFPDGWEETGELLMPDEVVVTDDWEEALDLIYWGHCLGYARNGHSIPPAIHNRASNVIGYVDSYDVVRYDSMNTFKNACRSGVYAIISVKTPDDWNNPAGRAA